MSRNSFSSKVPFQIHLLSIASLIGTGISVSLTQHFYELREGTSGFKSFCNINESMNCDVIAASPYAEFFFGLPLSSFAGGWFLALFFITLVAYNPFWRREALRAILALTAVGSLFAFPYLWIMASVLKNYCLFCLGVDGLNWISLGLVLSLRPEGFRVHPPDRDQWKVILPLIGASVFATVFALHTLNNLEIKSSDIDRLAAAILEKPAIPLRVGDEYPSFGPKDARITIVEFSDFQCPWCRVGAMKLNSVLNRFPLQVRVVFKNFPLDQSCNPLMQQTPHPVACEAARVAHCSYEQGKFLEIYEKFFEDQASFGQIHPTEMSKAVGIDFNQLQTCITSAGTAGAIDRDIEEGKLLGVTATPTFFINGHKAEGPQPVPVFNRVVETLLKEESPKKQ